MKLMKPRLLTAGARIIAGIAFASIAITGLQTAKAEGYPSKPITMIVPFKAGGSTEAMAQVLSKALGKTMGTKVIVKTRPGGGGAVGMTFLST